MGKIVAAILALLIVASQSEATRAIRTDSGPPPEDIAGKPNMAVKAMFLWSRSLFDPAGSYADVIHLGSIDEFGLPVVDPLSAITPLFCTQDITVEGNSYCSQSAPGQTRTLGRTGPDGLLPAGAQANTLSRYDDGQLIYPNGIVRLGIQSVPCGSFETEDGCSPFLSGYEVEGVMMNWVLPCPSAGSLASADWYLVLFSDICGLPEHAGLDDFWSKFGFEGAPSHLADLIGASNADLLASKLATGNLQLIAFQDRNFGRPEEGFPDPYTYDAAVLAVWFDPVPEPVTVLSFAAGLVLVAGARLAKKQAGGRPKADGV